MPHQDKQARHRQIDTRVDRSTRNLTPMERWAREKAKEQPWNPLASKTHASSGEYSSTRGTSSTRGQNGSVGERTK
jgi:hypothetical protein